MPGHRGKVIDLRERRVEEQVAEPQLEQDAKVDERIGNEIKDYVVSFEKTREPGGEGGNNRAFDVHERLKRGHPDESEGQKDKPTGESEESADDVEFRCAFDVVVDLNLCGVVRRAPGRNSFKAFATVARLQKFL